MVMNMLSYCHLFKTQIPYYTSMDTQVQENDILNKYKESKSNKITWNYG